MGSGYGAASKTLSELATERLATARVAELEAQVAAAQQHVAALLRLVPDTGYLRPADHAARSAALAWLVESEGSDR